jgi:site-specific DNA-methyltransferase (adenine-specific)
MSVIHHGDLFDVLPTLDAESIDALVTDPPYGIGFMGKKWDTFKPGEEAKRIVPNRAINSENPNLKGRTRGPASSPSAVEYDYSVKGLREFQAWTELWGRDVFRLMKPGAHGVVCGAPRSYHRMACGLEDAGFEVRDCLSWLFGQGFPKSLNIGDGLGTALKPAHEPIVLIRKPFKGSVAANVQQHGTGALNIDACRINPGEFVSGGGNGKPSAGASWQGSPRQVVEPHDLGRWPANVCLDEEAAAMLDEQSGDLASGARSGGDLFTSDVYGANRPGGVSTSSSGGASRFYYVAKPSREERDFGVSKNIHPTVKPVELMRWLVKLITPPGGVVLDPFLGSGTTGMAAHLEGRTFIGIEREAEYVAIARLRIHGPLFAEGADA